MMPRLLSLIVIVVAIFAVTTGVIQVQIHPEEAVNAPKKVAQDISSGALLEQARSLGIRAKRALELYSAQNETQKLEIALGFVRQDAERLEQLIKKRSNLEKITPQTELLAGSIKQAQELAQEVSEGDLADLGPVSQEAFGYADQAFAQLVAFQQELVTESDQLTNVLEEVAPDVESGDVAGTQDEQTTVEKTKEATPTPVSSGIPLRF